MHVLPICCKKFLVGQIVNSLIMKCIIAGSTGLIGGLLLNELLADNNFDEVVVLVRKEITLKNKKTQKITKKCKKQQKTPPKKPPKPN